ncbi:TOBE domain-containing protein [Shigella flexneri]
MNRYRWSSQTVSKSGRRSTAQSTGGGQYVLGIRPEHLLPSHIADVTLEGEVQVVEQLGHETQIHIQIPAIRQNLVYRQNDVVLVQEVPHSLSVCRQSVAICSVRMALHVVGCTKSQATNIPITIRRKAIKLRR